jgi:hypothetical protein
MGECVTELNPENFAGYVLLSNTDATTGNWDLRENVQQLRKKRGVKKPAQSHVDGSEE